MPIPYATSDVQRIASREGLSAVQQQNMVPSIVSISGLWDGVKDRVRDLKGVNSDVDFLSDLWNNRIAI